MGNVGSYIGLGSLVAQCADLTMNLSSIPTSLSPTLEDVVFVPIKLTHPERTRRRQRGLRRLPEVLAHRIASQTQMIGDCPQAHPLGMQFLHVLIQFPFAQETGL